MPIFEITKGDCAVTAGKMPDPEQLERDFDRVLSRCNKWEIEVWKSAPLVALLLKRTALWFWNENHADV